MQENFTITHIGDTELSLPMPFIVIEAASKSFEFQADDGSNASQSLETNIISLPKDYFLCAYPTTNEFWEAVYMTNLEENKKHLPSSFMGKTRPVDNALWEHANLFCEDLNALLNSDKVRFQEVGQQKGLFKLPTELEWEYAANSNDDFVFSGSQNLNDVGWFSKNSNGQTMPVGLKEPNSWGLYEMSGNVGEWCSNSSNGKSLVASLINENQNSDNNNLYALRGGSYFSPATRCRIKERSFQLGTFDSGHGFRLLFDIYSV